MIKRKRALLIQRLALSIVAAPFAFVPAATAQSYLATLDQSAYTRQDLDQMLAPIALYPDALLVQILMAATFPAEIREAARWSRTYPGVSGDAAIHAVQYQRWDPSVKSLAAFPQILQMMEEKIEWTERLGDAFLMQEAALMDAVQYLRQQATASGNLRSDEQLRVTTQGQFIQIEPAYPGIVYIPYYDTRRVYGTWRWSSHPPVYWAPWNGHYAWPRNAYSYAPGNAVLFSTGYFFGVPDWAHRRTRVIAINPAYYGRPAHAHRPVAPPPVIAVQRTVTVTPEPRRHEVDRARIAPDPAARRQFHRVPEPILAPAAPINRPDMRAAQVRLEPNHQQQTAVRVENTLRPNAPLAAPRHEPRREPPVAPTIRPDAPRSEVRDHAVMASTPDRAGNTPRISTASPTPAIASPAPTSVPHADRRTQIRKDIQNK